MAIFETYLLNNLTVSIDTRDSDYGFYIERQADEYPLVWIANERTQELIDDLQDTTRGVFKLRHYSCKTKRIKSYKRYFEIGKRVAGFPKTSGGEKINYPPNEIELSDEETLALVDKLQKIRQPNGQGIFSREKPYDYFRDMHDWGSCPYCEKKLKNTGWAWVCPNKKCLFWKYHSADVKRHEEDRVLNYLLDDYR